MASTEPRGQLDRLLNISFGVLLAAGMVYAAVRLIQAVMTGLLVVLGIALLAGIPVMVWKAKHRGW